MKIEKKKKLRTPKDVERLFNILRIMIAIAVAILFAFVVILSISSDPGEALSSFVLGHLVHLEDLVKL